MPFCPAFQDAAFRFEGTEGAAVVKLGLLLDAKAAIGRRYLSRDPGSPMPSSESCPIFSGLRMERTIN